MYVAPFIMALAKAGLPSILECWIFVVKNFLSMFLGLIGTAVLFVLPVNAATFSLDFSDPTVSLGMPVAMTSGTVHEGLTSSDTVDFMYKSPWDTTATPTESFTSVQAVSSAAYEFDTLHTSASFLWGSVDFYNSIIFKNAGSVVDELSGQAVIDAGAITGEEFVQITILAMAAFDEIVFQSTQHAFEFSNLNVSAIPLPAALPLFAAGILLFGFLGRRQKANV